ncbi:MAG: 3-hydroxyacyl-CoA dehydrogenase [Gammaproteobacteria bacterium]|nr:3-hydroxyacyl-CoA dehydrogenase [Gammaproteobacteria bacterium]
MNIYDIKTVAMIGAGDMGHGIAEVALLAGYKVNLYDIKDEFVDKGKKRIFESLDLLAGKGKIPPELNTAIREQLLTTTTDLAKAVGNADLVIEAIPEIMDLKKKVFAEIDQLAPAHTLLASNTSTMSISEIATATNRPDKVFGLHYFNPAVLMRLVEVIRADKTSDETMQIGMDFAAREKKVGVLVKKDRPGFIANRVNQAPAVLVSEILERGEVEPEALDAFVRMMGSAMGPCELTDYVGIDVAVNVSRYFEQTLGPDYGPPPHLLKMMEDGNLGKKTGKGYFEWPNGERPKIDFSKATRKFNFLWTIFVQINEATKLIEEGVVDTLDEVDLAMVNSSGMPFGPIYFGRQISKLDLIDNLEMLAERYDKPMFKPTKRVLGGGHKF